MSIAELVVAHTTPVKQITFVQAYFVNVPVMGLFATCMEIKLTPAQKASRTALNKETQ